ncbi:uncharacterized protein LOC126581639 [Anopheles aquasalis]|uniref:uncharacterized protein LOC126581639 n=1 Tax=Anopheles aquasalis TaxID=42839 RepID=UPI00215B09D6|nr:uncharacterized protein LOC126581639 [Anopheles aquasalis]
MDKAAQAAKRRQDKSHKRVPPPKPNKQTGKPSAAKPEPPEVQHTAPLVVVEARYSKREITQNWTEDRELPAGEGSSSEDEQLNAADFEKLLELPPSSGGHFLLSSEKHWLNPDTGLPGDDERNGYGEYFRIDTKQLNASLGCIPFYQRQGYDEKLFTASELNLMRQKAELQREKWGKGKENMIPTVPPAPTKPRPVPCLVSPFASPKDETAAKPRPPACLVGTAALPRDKIKVNEESVVKVHARKEEPKKVPVLESKLAELKIEPKQVTKLVPSTETLGQQQSTSKPESNDTKEDIQQWLDDILDI